MPLPRRTIIAACAAAFAFPSSARATISSMDYLGTYAPADQVKMWRGFIGDVFLRGDLLNTSTGVEVRNASGTVASGVTASIIARSIPGVPTSITIRVTPTASAAPGTYRVLIHYAIEVSGPDKFDVRVFEHGNVTSMQIEEAAESGGRYVRGRSYTLKATGTNLTGASFNPAAVTAGKVSLLQVVSTSATQARFLVRFDAAQQVSFGTDVMYDGAMGTVPTSVNCVTACYSGNGFNAIVGVLPTVNSASPNPLTVGANATFAGFDLAPRGYNVSVHYLRRYFPLAGGGLASSDVSATSTSSGVTFVTPASMRGDSIQLFYLRNFDAQADSLINAPKRVPTLSVAPEVPVLQGMKTVASTLAGEHKILVSGSQQLLGKNMAPLSQVTATRLTSTLTTTFSSTPVSTVLPTVTFAGTALTVNSAKYFPTANIAPFATGSSIPIQVGVDTMTVTMPARSDTLTGTLVITNAAGSTSIPNVLLAPPPKIIQVDLLLPNGQFQVVSSQTLIRGQTYRLEGFGLELRTGTTLLQRATVSLNGVTLPPLVFQNASSFGFRVPATATPGTITVQTIGGTSSTSSFNVVDAPSGIGVAGLVLSPNNGAGGNPITATIAFNGTVAPGTSAGTVVLSMTPADSAIVLPTAGIAITANPLVVTIPTRAVTSARSTTLTVSSAGTAASFASAALTLTPPAPNTLTLSSTSVTGGQSLTGTVQLNATVQSGAGISVTLASTDPTTATVPASVVPNGTSATFTVQTSIVPSARSVTINATSGGVTKSVTLNVNPPVPIGLAANANIIAETAANATLTISAAPPTPVIATISCNDAAVTCPATVSISGTSVSIPITSLAIPAARTVTMTATLNGVSLTRTFTLVPLAIQTVTLSPASVAAGVQSSMTIQLNAPVPSGSGINVQITSSNPTLASVISPAGFGVGIATKLVAITTHAPAAQSTPITFTVSFTRNTTFGAATSTATGTVTVTP